ncbi:MAG: tetratricopeptide repeat protein [Chloroflexi bacterium]|nr:tetratricopeptide repeat protein [Chloroflexota bacterium]
MKSSDIWNELGNTYFKAGEFDKAIDAYCKAIEQKTSSGWSYSNLATIYVQQGRYFDAIPLYQKSLELFSCRKDQAATWGRLGNVYHHLNEHGKAIQAFQKADEIMPVKDLTRTSLIFSLEKAVCEHESEIPAELGSFSGTQEISTAQTLTIDEPAFRGVDLDYSAPTLGILDDGLSRLENSIEQSATVWNELGLILFKVGSYDDAIDAYKKAIELDPGLGFLYSNLGQVCISQGRLDQAIDLFEKSIELLPNKRDKAISWTRLGDIYRQLSQYDEANAAYQLADALNQALVAPVNEFRVVSHELIITNQSQPRDLGDIEDLVGSIRMYGIIQPLIVCPGRNEPGKYLLIAGRRRLEAARKIGLKDVPVIVRHASELEVLELSINENIHSNALSPFELADGYRRMVNEFELSLEEIAARVGRSCHSVANTMKLFDHAELKGQSLPLEDRFNVKQDDGPMNVTAQVLNSEWARLPDEISVGSMEDNGIQVNTGKTDSCDGLSGMPVLWYLETTQDSVAVSADDSYGSETSSLLSRAQNVLKCNPHARRLLATPSYRA